NAVVSGGRMGRPPIPGARRVRFGGAVRDLRPLSTGLRTTGPEEDPMTEERRDAFQTTGIGQSGREMGGAHPHDGEGRQDENPESGWNRRRQYGAFYTNATERAHQRRRMFDRYGSMGESERGEPQGWSSRPGGHSHTPRFGGYRGGWTREGGEYGRSEERFGNEPYGNERYGSDRFGSDRYRGDFEERAERGREWGGGEGLVRRNFVPMSGSGRDIGH